MKLKSAFIQATEEFNTFETPVPAYYFRKSFRCDAKQQVKITVAVCGFYELYFNGERITRGFLSPYISNTDDYVYGDCYEAVAEAGENVLGILLGNGFQNNPGGHVWDFDKASFRSAPKIAFQLTDGRGNILAVGDESVRVFPSPIKSDDYRFGEVYDANCETAAWNRTEFDDSAWGTARLATPPKGEFRIADVAPIIKEREIKPVGITKHQNSYIYDFGTSHAGVCRLKIRGNKGQRIELRHADSLADGDPDLRQIWFHHNWERDQHIVHRDVYICKGEGIEEYQPTFAYHGFRYVRVDGIEEAQATEELLTYCVYHTDLHTRGDFFCSDVLAERLQEITRRSILSNFHHFPTDCPQREKNGWTADAALSCEAALLNFDPERNYREWMRNICKAQREDGALPGIVPTGGWGFHWGNGPAWDCVLAYLPYFTYVYRGKTEMISESADSFVAYLRYLRTRCSEQGLLAIGLGDWCHVGGQKPKAPLIVTDSIMAMDIANKIAKMLFAIGRTEDGAFAKNEARKYRNAIRKNLIDYRSMQISGECQTSQAMGLFYGVFDDTEKESAFSRLLEMIRAAGDHIDLGVLGGRVIFHVLSEFGYSDLAYRMILREDYPSYGNWLKRGATTLWENFHPDKVSSMNHHFWGDVSAWFIKCIAGIRLNPSGADVNTAEIRPSFIDSLERASAYHLAPGGKISVSWERNETGILLSTEIPNAVQSRIILEPGYRFSDGGRERIAQTETYCILKD
ncbi:MAG: family 78 glycoside hydrolase catalytic domain [Clostridia bacterium]|nr:family 78 glycoside hydrolase catalytic domain [Clostridia bacterium]